MTKLQLPPWQMERGTDNYKVGRYLMANEFKFDT